MSEEWKTFATQLIEGNFAPIPVSGEVYRESLLLTPEAALFPPSCAASAPQTA